MIKCGYQVGVPLLTLKLIATVVIKNLIVNFYRVVGSKYLELIFICP